MAIRQVVIISYDKQIPTNFTFHLHDAQYELFILRGTRGKTNQGGKNYTCFYHLKIKSNLKHSYLINHRCTFFKVPFAYNIKTKVIAENRFFK